MENETLIAWIEGTTDLLRHFNLLLHSAARDQCGIEPRKNFVERKRHGNTITIQFSGKDVGRKLAQFAKADPHGTAGKLRKNFFQWNRDGEIADLALDDSRLKFERQPIQDRLQRNLHGTPMSRLRLGLRREIAGGLSRGSLRLGHKLRRGAASVLPMGSSAGRLRLRSRFGFRLVILLDWSRSLFFRRCFNRLPQ